MPRQSRTNLSPEEREKKRQADRTYYQRKKAQAQKTIPSLSESSPSPSPEQPVLVGNGVAEESKPVQRVTRDEREYTKLLDLYLGPVIAMILVVLCLTLARQPMPIAEAFANEYKPNPDELDLIIPPLARVLDRAKLPDQVKTTVLNSGDMLGLTLGVTAYLLRTGNAFVSLARGGMQHGTRQPVQEQPAPSSANGVFTVANLAQYRAD